VLIYVICFLTPCQLSSFFFSFFFGHDVLANSIKEEYDAACNHIIAPDLSSTTANSSQEPASPGITIGSYQNCHHVASGLVSSVYRSKSTALKVITETRNVEPHDGIREVKILQKLSHPHIITLLNSFRDSSGHLVLEFPFQPLTLSDILSSSSGISSNLTKSCFRELFLALSYLHEQDIIHRDIKPSNILLASPSGPILLCDFGTAWNPTISPSPSSVLPEPADHKVLEVGTTCYRAPETLFGNRAYSTSLDMWAAGTMLAECLHEERKPLFESRGTEEDGNQLGLILSIFKTLGTPTEEIWPEAKGFTTPPFQWYRDFPGKGWEELLPGVDVDGRDLVSRLVCYESGQRLTAVEVCLLILYILSMIAANQSRL